MDQSKIYIQDLVRLNKYNLTAIGYQKLTVDNTSGGVALTVPADATYALMELESSVTTGIVIRYLECGKTIYTVTTTDGIGRAHLDAFDVHGAHNLNNFRAIQAQAGTHTLHIQYYK
jgi:hypothetical protein